MDRGRQIVGGVSFWDGVMWFIGGTRSCLSVTETVCSLCRVIPLCEAMSYMLEGWRKGIE